MSASSWAFRRDSSLDSRLRERLGSRCQLLKGTAAGGNSAPGQRGFQESPCRDLGLCICTMHRDAMHMFRNVAAYLRSVFWKRNKVPSPLRAQLDKKKIFLKFCCLVPRSRTHDAAAATGSADDSASDEPRFRLRYAGAGDCL